MYVNPKELHFDNVRSMRGIEETDHFQRLLESIQSRHQAGLPPIVEPVTIYKRNEKWYVAGGHRRVRAHQVLDIEKILAMEVDPPPDRPHLLIDQIVVGMGDLREDLNPMDVAAAIKELKGHGYSQKMIATSLGRSEPWVSMHLALLDLAEPLQDAVRSGEMHYQVAYECKAKKIPLRAQAQYAQSIINAASTRKSVAQAKRGVGEIAKSIERTEGVKKAQPKPKTQPPDLEEEEPDEALQQARSMLALALSYVKSAMETAKEENLNISAELAEIEKAVKGE